MREMSAHKALKRGESIALHMVAVVVGGGMTVVGIGMGITMFLLPIALPLGLTGAGIFTWGLVGFGEKRRQSKGGGQGV